MEAIELLKTLKRICSKYKCSDCPVVARSCICIKNISITSDETLNSIIENVEQWSKEHPIITNAQKFKEVFGDEAIYAISSPNVQALKDWLDEPYKEAEHD